MMRAGVLTRKMQRMTVGGRPVIDVAVQEAETIWDTTLEKYFTQRAA